VDPDRGAVPAEEADDDVSEAWLRRPFARTFDLISSSYGWTDEQILDLPIGRINQVRDVILERQDEDWKRRLRLEEASLQHICASIHGAAGNAEGMKQSQRIALYERGVGEITTRLPRSEDIERLFDDGGRG
jgi:hypothetical protein